MTYLTSVAGGIADSGSTTHDSPSLTVSGSNKVLYVFVGNSDGSPATPSGVVWDPAGVNQALALQGSGITYGSFGNASLWRLIAPSNATGVVRATWAATKGERIVCAWVETDLNQTTPNGTVATASNSANGTSVSVGPVTTSVGQRVLNFAHTIDTSIFLDITPFASPSGTERHNVSTAGTAYDAIGAQEQTAVGASVTPTWTIAETPEGWAAFAFALNAAAGAEPIYDEDGSTWARAAFVGAVVLAANFHTDEAPRRPVADDGYPWKAPLVHQPTTAVLWATDDEIVPQAEPADVLDEETKSLPTPIPAKPFVRLWWDSDPFKTPTHDTDDWRPAYSMPKPTLRLWHGIDEVAQAAEALTVDAEGGPLQVSVLAGVNGILWATDEVIVSQPATLRVEDYWVPPFSIKVPPVNRVERHQDDWEVQPTPLFSDIGFWPAFQLRTAWVPAIAPLFQADDEQGEFVAPVVDTTPDKGAKWKKRKPRFREPEQIEEPPAVTPPPPSVPKTSTAVTPPSTAIVDRLAELTKERRAEEIKAKPNKRKQKALADRIETIERQIELEEDEEMERAHAEAVRLLLS